MKGSTQNKQTAEGAATLNNSWVPILKTGEDGSGGHIGQDDIDAIVRNYRSGENKAPIGVELDWPGAKPHGYVDELRRDGNTLTAKLSNVDPRLDQLNSDGYFKKKVVTLRKTPKGFALHRVGFVRSGSHADIESLHNDNFGKQDVDFAESRANSFRVSASDVVKRYRDAGMWSEAFDRFQFATILERLEKNAGAANFGEGRTQSAFEVFTDFIGYIAPAVQYSDRSGVISADGDLAQSARHIARREGVSYGEGLERAVARRSRAANNAEFSEKSLSGSVSGVDLNRAVWDLVDESGLTFGEALERVVRDRPDLAER